MTGGGGTRRQIDDARQALTLWSTGDARPSPVCYDWERVLAGHLRAMLAVVDEGMPDGLAAANGLRQAVAGQRDARLARLIMDTGWVWDRLNAAERRLVTARAEGPGESWTQTGRRLHVSKNAAAAAWRRLLHRWDVQRVTGARVEDGQVVTGGRS